MAGGPDALRFLIEHYGSIEQAEEQARSMPGFGDEIRKIENQLALSGIPLANPDAAPSVALRHAELRARRWDLVMAALEPRSRKSNQSKQGKWEGKAFSPTEVGKVAALYMKNPDLTPWEVWVRYERVRDLEDNGRLGRGKVDDLLAALDDGTARWNAKRERVEGLERSLREPGRVLVPRS